jgi:hypothetical protein
MYSKIIIRIIAFLLAVPSLSAREWFVAPNGNDSNDGNIKTPLLSIQKACSLALAGDTVTIREGLYSVNEQIKPKNSGRPDAWITYRAMKGENVIIDGSQVEYVNKKNDKKAFSLFDEGLVQIENISYIKWQDITVRDSHAAGFLLRGGSQRTFNAGIKNQGCKIILENCKSIHSYNSGIGIWYVDSVTIKNCTVTESNDLEYRVAGVQRHGEAPHEAISICGAQFFEILGNHVYNCNKEGIDCKEVSRHGKIHHNIVNDLPRQAYYIDAWFGLLEDVEFHDNFAYDCFWGFAISVEGKDSKLQNVRFHHNIICNMKASGLLFGMWGYNNLRSDIHIYNNTFYRCGSPNVYSGGVGSIELLSSNYKDVFIYRNICDKGWDYEIGFNATQNQILEKMSKKDIVIQENLIESIKNRPSRIGQFNANLIEYFPNGNQIGAPLYQDEINFDMIPEKLPKVKLSNTKWKYPPSKWYGAHKPIYEY